METASQFVARALDLLPFPPTMARQRVRVGRDDRCWLCGGAVVGKGWDRDDAFPDTFTNVNLAVCPTSRTVCQGCAAVSRGETWLIHAARRPDLNLKTVHPLSWRTYSHVVTETTHDCPDRARLRVALLEPPEPPFVIAVAESGQKHLLFRCRIAWSRDRFPVQIEETPALVDRAAFAECLAAFEALYALGCNRDEIASGRYSQGKLGKIGLTAWRNAEQRFAPWRRRAPELVRLAAFVAWRPERESAWTTSQPTRGVNPA